MEKEQVEKYVNEFDKCAEEAVNAVDFDKTCMYASMSAEIQYQWNQNYTDDRLGLLHYYPYFDQEIPFGGFPFSDEDKPVLFSGGSLYKTYGDKGTYYDIVRKIMQHNKDVLFVYAGSGDSSRMEKLQTEFPKRVYLIAERRDLYAVMQHATLYLNTYPMLGGLMTQYAAIAGRLPLTLLNCPENSLDGLLLNHKEMQLEFTCSEDLVAEADKLLSDDNYRKQRERQLKDCVMDEDKFRHELGNLLEKGNTDFKFTVHNIDTTDFRRPYIYRFTVDSLANAIVNKKTVAIWWKYPQLLIRRLKNKFIK